MRTTLLSLTLLVLSAPPVAAAVPSQFSLQGVLRDGTGKLQSMQVAISVGLYDAQTGGTTLGLPVAAQPVMAEGGLFTLTVDVTPELASAMAAAPAVWLELTVDADVFPRQVVTPEIYALMCGTADRASSLVGVLPPASGGTGLASVGAAGGFLRSDGTAWVSAPIGPGDLPSLIVQDDAVATSASTASTTFVDATGLPTFSYTAPATRTYLVHVDLSCYVSAASRVQFRLLLDGAAVANQPVNAMSYFFNTASEHNRLSFRVPVAMTAGAHVLKLQWLDAGGQTVVTDGNDFRTFTVGG